MKVIVHNIHFNYTESTSSDVTEVGGKSIMTFYENGIASQGNLIPIGTPNNAIDRILGQFYGHENITGDNQPTPADFFDASSLFEAI